MSAEKEEALGVEAGETLSPRSYYQYSMWVMCGAVQWESRMQGLSNNGFEMGGV